MADLHESFRILGVSDNATLDQARSAWRLRAEVLHPDRLQGSRPEVQAEAENQLKELNEAWRIVRLDLTQAEPHVAYAYFGATRAEPRDPTTPTKPTGRRLITRESRNVIVLVALLVLSTSFLGYRIWDDSHPPAQYPALVQSDFINACQTAGPSLSTCRCVLDQLMDQVPLDDFTPLRPGARVVDQMPASIDYSACI